MDATLHATGEDQMAVTLREQRVVLAATDVLAGMELRATLAHDDVASLYVLASKLLDAKSLCVGVTTVTG